MFGFEKIRFNFTCTIIDLGAKEIKSKHQNMNLMKGIFHHMQHGLKSGANPKCDISLSLKFTDSFKEICILTAKSFRSPFIPVPDGVMADACLL